MEKTLTIGRNKEDFFQSFVKIASTYTCSFCREMEISQLAWEIKPTKLYVTFLCSQFELTAEVLA